MWELQWIWTYHVASGAVWRGNMETYSIGKIRWSFLVTLIPVLFSSCFLCKWFISKLLYLLMHETGRRRVHWSCCNGNIKLLERTSGPKQLFRGEIVSTWIWLPASDNMLQTPGQSFVTNYVTHFGAVLLRM